MVPASESPHNNKGEIKLSVLAREITIAHSPDSDDAFMFYALAHNKLDTHGFQIKQVLNDIQSLNQAAIEGIYDVSAISFAAYPQVAHRYMLMPCGASMGINYGPVVVAKHPLDRQHLKRAVIAIPGKLTTAYLALRLFQPDLKVIELPFDQISNAVKESKADAGLLIHEGQLTYHHERLVKIVDLGEWWHEQTGLPLPLGGNVIRKDLGKVYIKQITELLKKSIVYSLEHRAEAVDYAMSFARGMNKSQADKFIGMYVNELTVDFGEQGRVALKLLFEKAYEAGLVDHPVEVEFASL